MSLLANSNAIESGGYNIDRSLRFRSSASAYLNRTPASAGNRQKFTWSGWVKRGALGTFCTLLDAHTGSAGGASGSFSVIRITDADQILVWEYAGSSAGSYNWYSVSSQVFRDPSAWYHIVVSVDTTSSATMTTAYKVYVNGSQITMAYTTNQGGYSQNYSSKINLNTEHYIGRYWWNTYYTDVYLAEVNFIDGQALTPSSFGQTDAVTGVWTPKKYTGTYGTNGFYLDFKDNTSATTLAYDKSGNGNNWTANNISTTAGATYDSMTDVPTLTSATAANYCTWNPLTKWRGTLSNGNLSMSGTSGDTTGTMSLTAGKWYYECTILGGTNEHNIGFAVSTVGANASAGAGIRGAGSYVIYSFNGQFYNSGSASPSLTTFAANDVVMFAYDADNSKIYVGKNGTWLNSAVPASGTGAVSTTATAPLNPIYQFDSGNATGCNTNFGQQPFSYTPPTGFKALNTFNLPDPTIKIGSSWFDVKLDTGANIKGTAESTFTGDDLIWIKDRANSNNHQLIDTIRGSSAVLQSNTTSAETTYSAPSGNSVAWCWKKGATPGFDIVTYTGTGSNRTVSHSLGVTPSMMIVKNRSFTTAWRVYHQTLGNTQNVRLNLTNASAVDSGIWNNTSPTSSVFTVGTDADVNRSGDAHVAYLFAEIAGFSKFGSYTGNGSADGPFVYCGFRPKYVMIKRTDSIANWNIYDTSRNTSNINNNVLGANLSNAEFQIDFDIISNGFKCRDAGGGATNASGGTYIYMAFAESPFKTSLAR